MVFHHDKARPRVSLMTYHEVLFFGWDVFAQPPYYSGIAPSDYYLVRSVQHDLNGKTFETLDDVKKHLEQFFAQKSLYNRLNMLCFILFKQTKK